jgi:MFS family permease
MSTQDPSGAAGERRLVLLVSAVVFVDTMFYAVVAPLLPSLAHDLHLSKLSAGLLTASYAAGTLAGSLPAGVLVVRAGPRFAVCLGLVLLACSTVAFGFLHNVVMLDAARFVEGVGGACSWAGGLAWIVAETPPERRGGLIGRALGAAIGGALLGPAIGTVATALGRGPTFSVLVLIVLGLIEGARQLESHHEGSEQGIRQLASALRDRQVAVGVWLVTLPAIASGAIAVLGPLRLHRLGAGAAAIGATFLVAAAFEAAVSPAVGTLSDRRGRLVPLRFGLAASSGLLLCFTLPGSAVLLAVVIAAIGAAIGAFWAPAMAMLSEAADAHGLEQGLAAALMNLAWAGGQIVGSGVGGAVAKQGGDALPLAVTAGLCLASLVLLTRNAVRGSLVRR